jgi:hypothetical protein
MSTLLIVFLILVWVASAIYVMVYHGRRWRLGLDIIIGAIILGPILALLIGDDEEKIIKEKRKKERETNDRHRKWFQTLGLINKNAIPNYWKSIPPPPPISRIAQSQSERETAIRSAIERIEPPNRRPNNKKDFKFFH